MLVYLVLVKAGFLVHRQSCLPHALTGGRFLESQKGINRVHAGSTLISPSPPKGPASKCHHIND